MDNKEKTYLATNLKHLRNVNNKSLNEIGSICDKTDVAVHYWENGTREPNAVDIAKLSNYYNITIDNLLLKDLRFDNAEAVDISSNCIKIPVLGVIKAGVPIEAQEDILDFVEIPKNWTFGEKQFYGLKISGDSMFPKYNEDDIVIFEKNDDMISANNKDCAVMVNGDDATFKKVLINENGIVLVPYNNAAYDMIMYSKEDIENKPIRIIGIAREKRSKL